MPPVTDYSVLPKTMEKQTSKSGGSNIWSTLLSDTSVSSSHVSLLVDKSVVILGNDLSGKTVLTTKLQGLDKSHRGSGLDFQAIEVQEEDVDETGLCRVWIVDGHLAYRNLLNFAIPKPMVSHSILVVVVDMSQPWSIPENLQKWIDVAKDYLNTLGLSASEKESLNKEIRSAFHHYAEPSENALSSRIQTPLPSAIVDDGPGNELALSSVFGMPLVVVCSKCDNMESLELEFDLKEEHFDFIQYYLRMFCLKYGAALVYTSMKENKNIEVLKRYILHKLYGFSFDTSASVVDRDAVFIPSGWDSESKINILKDNFSFSGDDAFETVISKPTATRMHDMKEITADDEQAFLVKAQAALAKVSSTSKTLPGTKAAKDDRTGVSSPVTNVGGMNKLKMDPTKAGASNERMLASFFNSLLNKKPAGALGGSPQGRANTSKSEKS